MNAFQDTMEALLNLEDRIPVWVVLSELFLDTELSDADCDQMARALAASRYSLKELEEILRDEVAPVCEANLRSAAGEWSGFDQQWLVEQVASRLPQRRPRLRRSLRRSPIWGSWSRVRDRFAGR